MITLNLDQYCLLMADIHLLEPERRITRGKLVADLMKTREGVMAYFDMKAGRRPDLITIEI